MLINLGYVEPKIITKIHWLWFFLKQKTKKKPPMICAILVGEWDGKHTKQFQRTSNVCKSNSGSHRSLTENRSAQQLCSGHTKTQSNGFSVICSLPPLERIQDKKKRLKTYKGQFWSASFHIQICPLLQVHKHSSMDLHKDGEIKVV